MKVRMNANIYISGQEFRAGEVYVLDDELAKWLEGFYEVLEDKDIERPERDKMVRNSKKKGE
jgi:hypothetical protein